MIIAAMNPKLTVCPHCKNIDYVTVDIGMSKHSQCKTCGYAKHKMIEFVDGKSKLTTRIFEEPIGCAILETDSAPTTYLSLDIDNYDQFIIWLTDNKDHVISCNISCVKDGQIKLNDLMKMI